MHLMQEKKTVFVCHGPACAECGAGDVTRAIGQAYDKRDLEAVPTGCMGYCHQPVNVSIDDEIVGFQYETNVVETLQKFLPQIPLQKDRPEDARSALDKALDSDDFLTKNL